MSLTSYRAAPPRGGEAEVLGFEPGAWVDWKTWRRPTLPCLKTQYHGRWGISRPSSGWDRVQAPRHDHQVVQCTLGGFVPPGCDCGSGCVSLYHRRSGFVCFRKAPDPPGRLERSAAWAIWG